MKTIHTILILISICVWSCQPWDLDRLDFIELEVLKSEAISLSAINVQAEIKGIEQSKIIQHGFIWSAFDSIPEIGRGNSLEEELGALTTNRIFETTLTDLSIETRYFIRVFAITETATFYSPTYTYSNEDRVTVDFLSLNAIIGSSNALAIGNVNGLLLDESIQQYGHCWSSFNTEPEIADNSTNLGTTTGNIDSFTSVLTNLTSGETYFVRPYVVIADIPIYGPSQEITKGNYWVEKSGLPNTGVNATEYFSIDGKGYFVLGTRGGSSKELWEYTPVNDSWKSLPSFPGEWRRDPFAISKGRTIYIGLGRDGTSSGATYYNDIWAYDIDTESWNQKANFTGPLRVGTCDMNIDGDVYMAFGADTRVDPWIRYNEIWKFDPDGSNSTEQWTLHSTCEDGVRFEGGAFAIGGIGYLMGGAGATLNVANEMWSFDPTENEHCQRYDIYNSIDRNRLRSGIMTDGTYGYIACGTNNNESTNNFWLFNPNNFNEDTGLPGSWTRLADFANGTDIRAGVVAFVLEDRIFVGFGNSNSGNTNNLWEYISD